MRWSRTKLVVAGFAVATVIGLIEATQVYVGSGAAGIGFSWRRSLSSTLPSWYVMVCLLPPAFALASRFRLDGPRWKYNVPIHLIASIVFTALHIGIASWISDYTLLPGNAKVPFFENLARLLSIYFVLDTMFYWLLIGGYYAFDYNRRYREHERAAADLAVKASRLETSLTRANLETLRMQLNPHFLFNTLNTVSVLAMKGEKHKVVRMISRLSDLLRLSLENTQQTVSLHEEIDFLKHYVEIEQVRFRDKLTVEFNIDEDTLDAEVPSLVLQPLVENAIRHGIAQQTGIGRVEIGARKDGSLLHMWVRDTGPGFRPDQVGSGTGVGLTNTAARLEQLYGSEQEIRRENADGGGAIVTIRLPFKINDQTETVETAWRKSAP